MDGCAILWVIAWPSRGTVQDFVDGFVKHILDKLEKCKLQTYHQQQKPLGRMSTEHIFKLVFGNPLCLMIP